MTEFLVDAHRWWQYVALLAVVSSLLVAFRKPMMDPTSGMVYQVAAVIVDIQVALGIALWIVTSGWDRGVVQGWLHPIAGLLAVGVIHASVARARTGHPEVANRAIRIGFGSALVLVAVAIGLAEAL